ncbi:MAG: OmpH family outer membrane protein [Spirosomataceae bacterium]
MKKITLLVLGLAVATVACNKDAGTDAAKAQPAGRIVYVNTDTLLNNYDYYKDVVKEFQNKQFQLENELQRKGQSFQNEVALFQRRVQAGGMSQEQAQTTQQQLAQKEQNLMMYRDNAANNLAVEQGQKTDELLTKIQEYLAKYNAGDKYDMVIGYSKGGGVLYAKEDLDITQDVLKGLNEDYAKTKKSTVKTDSTAKK